MDKIEMLKQVSPANKKAADELLSFINKNTSPFVSAKYYPDGGYIRILDLNNNTLQVDSYRKRIDRISRFWYFDYLQTHYRYVFSQSEFEILIIGGNVKCQIPLETIEEPAF